MAEDRPLSRHLVRGALLAFLVGGPTLLGGLLGTALGVTFLEGLRLPQGSKIALVAFVAPIAGLALLACGAGLWWVSGRVVDMPDRARLRFVARWSFVLLLGPPAAALGVAGSPLSPTGAVGVLACVGAWAAGTLLAAVGAAAELARWVDRDEARRRDQVVP